MCRMAAPMPANRSVVSAEEPQVVAVQAVRVQQRRAVLLALRPLRTHRVQAARQLLSRMAGQIHLQQHRLARLPQAALPTRPEVGEAVAEEAADSQEARVVQEVVALRRAAEAADRQIRGASCRSLSAKVRTTCQNLPRSCERSISRVRWKFKPNIPTAAQEMPPTRSLCRQHKFSVR
jgi:hypothetical protein